MTKQKIRNATKNITLEGRINTINTEARDYGILENIKEREVLSVFAAQLYKCYCCNDHMDKTKKNSIRLARLTPLQDGGENNIGNVVAVCSFCGHKNRTHKLRISMERRKKTI